MLPLLEQLDITSDKILLIHEALCDLDDSYLRITWDDNAIKYNFDNVDNLDKMRWALESVLNRFEGVDLENLPDCELYKADVLNGG